jgi:CAAX protease family protein
VKLSDPNKAAIFTALVLLMALAAALAIRALGMMPGLVASALCMSIPAEAALIMMLVITRDGYAKEGWKVLGLHESGLEAWWIAILAPCSSA